MGRKRHANDTDALIIKHIHILDTWIWNERKTNKKNNEKWELVLILNFVCKFFQPFALLFMKIVTWYTNLIFTVQMDKFLVFRMKTQQIQERKGKHKKKAIWNNLNKWQQNPFQSVKLHGTDGISVLWQYSIKLFIHNIPYCLIKLHWNVQIDKFKQFLRPIENWMFQRKRYWNINFALETMNSIHKLHKTFGNFDVSNHLWTVCCTHNFSVGPARNKPV